MTVKDYPSRELFEQLMADEEGHIDFLETQLELHKKLGEALYMQAHLEGLGEGGTPGLRGEG
jgi:bacterioferritin